jgi:four helix bundle protein
VGAAQFGASGYGSARLDLAFSRMHSEQGLVLDHERLHVYQAARELSREICRVRKKIGRGRPDMVDQLLRTTGSVPLNIAEGSGERLPGRRAYFYRIARSAATEVGAALDHLVDMDLLQPGDIPEAKRLLVRIVAMLVRLTDRTAQTSDSFPPLPRRRHPGKP